jgi:hypothetical protein
VAVRFGPGVALSEQANCEEPCNGQTDD